MALTNHNLDALAQAVKSWVERDDYTWLPRIEIRELAKLKRIGESPGKRGPKS